MTSFNFNDLDNLLIVWFAQQLRAALELPGPAPVMCASPLFCVLSPHSKQKLEGVGVHLHVVWIYLVSQVKATSVNKEVLSLREKKRLKQRKALRVGFQLWAFPPLHLCFFNRGLQLISERFSPIFLIASSFSLNVPVGALQTVLY